MPRGEPNPTRSEIRSWLKMADRSGLLDRIRVEYEPTGQDARDHARDLLARLQSMDGPSGPIGTALAEATAFRRWVEGRLKASRQIILGGEQGDRPRPPRLQLVRKPTPPAPRHDDLPSGRPVRPELDPLWDRWLDG